MVRALEKRDISAFHLPFTWLLRFHYSVRNAPFRCLKRYDHSFSEKKPTHFTFTIFFCTASLLRDAKQLCVKIGCSCSEFEKFLVYKSTGADFGARTSMSSVKGLFLLLGVVATSLELQYIMHYHLSEELSETSVICFGARFRQAFSHD